MAESLPPVCYVVVQPHAEEATCADSGRHPGQAYKQKIRANSVKGLCNKTLKLYLLRASIISNRSWESALTEKRRTSLESAYGLAVYRLLNL